MKKFIIITILILSMNLLGNKSAESVKLSTKTGVIVAEISNYLVEKRYNYYYYFEGSIYNNDYQCEKNAKQEQIFYEQLLKSATKNELISLTNCRNTAIQAYAFTILSKDKTVDLFPMILNHLDNDEIVYIYIFGETILFGDYIISLINLTEKQKIELDKALILTTSTLKARKKAYSNYKGTNDEYLEIKKLALQRKSVDPFYLLAKYKKAEDIKIITDAFDDKEFEIFFTHNDIAATTYKYHDLYEIIKIFPHENFLTYLEKEIKKISTQQDLYYDIENLFNSVLLFDNKKAQDLLLFSFSIKNKGKKERMIEHLNNVMMGVKHSTKKYEDVFMKLWLEGNHISKDVYKSLYKQNREKTTEITKKYLKKNEINFDHKDIDVISLMLNNLVKDDPKFLTNFIIGRFDSFSEETLFLACDIIIKMKNKDFVKPLLNKLSEIGGTINSDEVNKLIECLLNYENDDIKKSIIEVIEAGGFDPNDYLKE
ncbi:hypothetical protein [Fusobacterium sp. PH5-44]|uniref:hypothetical protein n=1 Tax=unclassified Fusobacterium TaxID=2648384 RepID=UPI003D1A4CA4